MKKTFAILLLALAGAAGGFAAPAAASPLLRNPALLNIGFICQWQARCMDRQQHAMKRALTFVNKRRPPVWKVQQCNRNAGRARQRADWRRGRVDWIGFDNCIRNKKLRSAAARRAVRR